MRSNEARDAAPGLNAFPARVVMSTPENTDSIHPALRRAEAELAHHLEEACDDHDRENIGEESTDELLRLEEELLAAARAVDKAVWLRRKLGDEKAAAEKQAGPPEPAPAETAPTRVREFRTASGSEWRVWEVRPGAGGRPRKLELYPVDYIQGWLAFEALQGERRKRLPKFAPEWGNAADADLEHLLDQAVDVPKRKPRPNAAPASEPPPQPPLESPPGD
jgi:hypothetical protein